MREVPEISSAVETPHLTRALNARSKPPSSSNVYGAEQSQRSVSTEGPTLFRGRYRVQSTRLPGWDYRSSGYYFVTICTKGREPFFGEVVDGSVVLSTIGQIVGAEWRGIEVRRRDVEVDEWVVMPNHIHGIVILCGRPTVETPHRLPAENALSAGAPLSNGGDAERFQRGASTASRLAAGSLGAIIGQFKSRSTKRILRAGYRNFRWQPRFYDHIIRNERSLNDICRYIAHNPKKWELDKDNVENLYM